MPIQTRRDGSGAIVSAGQIIHSVPLCSVPASNSRTFCAPGGARTFSPSSIGVGPTPAHQGPKTWLGRLRQIGYCRWQTSTQTRVSGESQAQSESRHSPRTVFRRTARRSCAPPVSRRRCAFESARLVRQTALRRHCDSSSLCRLRTNGYARWILT